MSEPLAEAFENPFDAPIPSELPTPLYWRVLIMPIKPLSKITLSSGVTFYLPEQSQSAQQFLNAIGRLVAVGESAFTAPALGVGKKQPPNVHAKIGDWVLYGRAAGCRYEYDGTKLVEINDNEILAVVPDPSKLKLHV